MAMIIYNLFPRLCGKFSKWTPHLERAASMSFDWIFINPVNEPGRSGSLYAVKDYYKFNPIFLDENEGEADEQFKSMIKNAHDLGLRVMMDLTINHSANECQLINEHSDWYKHDKNGRVVHPSCNENGKKVEWGDLAEFDHNCKDKDALIKYFDEVIAHYQSLGVDGFRCDAAYQLPPQTWNELISSAHKRDDSVVFSAETLGCTPQETVATAGSGFDYIFNSSKWWDFSAPWCLTQYNLFRDITTSISFPESHDTERLYAETNGNANALKQRYLFACVFSGAVMMPIGYEFGFSKTLNVVETSPSDWEETDEDITEFITACNNMKKSTPVLADEGPVIAMDSNNQNVLALWLADLKNGEEVLFLLNKDVEHHQEYSHNCINSQIHNPSRLKDISPEFPMPEIQDAFHYSLRPGQGIVMLSK